MAECKCHATINEKDPRYEIWVQIYPDNKIPLKHPLTHTNPHFPGKTFYEADTSKLTKDQKTLIVELMHKKFDVPKDHIRETLSKDILPICSDNVLVSICNLHFRCMI